MWNLVHQPGPLRLSELFGRIEWPQPRLQLTEKDESTPLLTIPTTETKNRVLAKPPSDILTPPQTPPTLSPTSSDTVIERSSSPLGSVTSELELPEAASAPIEENEDTTLPWPILEDEPTYRVDTSIGIFNYDCGLFVSSLFLLSLLPTNPYRF